MKNPAHIAKLFVIIVLIWPCQYTKAQSDTSYEQKALDFFMDSLYRKKEPFKDLKKLYSTGFTDTINNRYSIAQLDCLEKSLRRIAFSDSFRLADTCPSPKQGLILRKHLRKHKFAYGHSIEIFQAIRIKDEYVVEMEIYLTLYSGIEVNIILDKQKHIVKWCEGTWVI
jgi:hypothetical protein